MARFDEDVQKVQMMLKALDYAPGPLDGIQGRRTTEAIWAFQEDYDMDTYDEIDDELIGEIHNAFLNDETEVYGDVLQLMLYYSGYDPGTIDGIIGENTQNAIWSFQEDNDLEVTGDWNDETLQLLSEYLYYEEEEGGC